MNFTNSNKRFGKYSNPYAKSIKRKPWHFLLWKVGYYKDQIDQLVPKDFSYPVDQTPLDENAPKILWINHCTFLIQVGEQSLLTDPIFCESCSPISFLGPTRKHPPGISIENLPKIDVVLLSHNHYDHLDEESVHALQKRFPELEWVVPLGVKKWFRKRKIERVKELSWGEAHRIGSAKITAVPAQHFSGRGILDSNRTLWNGYIAEFSDWAKTLYFSGDTGYNSYDFSAIGEHWKCIDLALIPIGTYIPRKFMQSVHINPKEAVQIHKDVKAKFSIGMHWKTFRLSDEPMDLPPYELFLTMENEGLNPKCFVALEPGTYVNW